MKRTLLLSTLLLLGCGTAAPPDPWKQLAFSLHYGYDGAAKGLEASAKGEAGIVFREESGFRIAHLVVDTDQGLKEWTFEVTIEGEEIHIGRIGASRLDGEALILPDGGRLQPDDGTLRRLLQQSRELRYLLTDHPDAKSLERAEKENAPKEEHVLWARLRKKDYIDPEVGPAGMGLRFKETKDGRRVCEQYQLGCGRPILGVTTVEVRLKGRTLRIGEQAYDLDPETLALTRKGSKPILPDTFVLESLLKAQNP